METKSTKRLKFSRLCLSQSRAAKDGLQPSTSTQSSQISKFFNRPSSSQPPTTHSEPSTSSAVQLTDQESATVDPMQLDNQENSTTTNNESEPKTMESSTDRTQKTERVKTKRLFEEGNSTAGSKKTIKNFFANEHNDSLSDFEVPAKIARKTTKASSSSSSSSSTSAARKTKTSKSRSKKQPDIRKIMKKQNDGIALNEDEQMQLAVELSKVDSAENLDPTYFDQFEYKAKNQRPKQLASIFGAQKFSKVQAKWKSKCTPLTRRNIETQNMRKREQIDAILTDNILIESRQMRELKSSEISGADCVFEISSKNLQRICVAEKILYELDKNDADTRQCLYQYYTNNLVEPSTVVVGALLRDWGKIPGRDSIFDGITPALLQTEAPVTQEMIEDHDHDPCDIEPNEKELNASPVPEPNTVSNIETENAVAGPTAEDEIATVSAETDDTLIVDPNDIEAELNMINTRIRASQEFIDAAPSTMNLGNCGESIATYSHRGPSPDLFDDDDGDCGYGVDYFHSDSLVCSNSQKQINADEDVIEIEDSPPANVNGEIINDLANKETNVSPTKSSQSFTSNAFIEISDESNPTSPTVTKSENNIKIEENSQEEFNHEATPSTALSPQKSPKVLSFTERLMLMERDMMEGYNLDIPENFFTDSGNRRASQQLSQESIELSDDEINYSMNLGRRSMVIDQRDSPSPTATNHEPNSSNGEIKDLEFDDNYDCNALHEENDAQLVHQSISEMFERTFEYRDPTNGSETRDKLATPKNNKQSLKKTHSEFILGSNRPSHSSDSCSRQDNIKRITTKTDLSTADYIIECGALSPKPDYESMGSTELQLELKKFGLKQSLKKRQAIICLEYIYNRTHPYIDCTDVHVATKTGKEKNAELIPTSQMNGAKESKLNFNIGFALDQLVDAKFQQTEIDRYFLPSWPRPKRPWCLQPLHIAWHNLVKANTELFKTILMYKPIELHDLKKYFKTIDMTFDQKDLIAFLDIHCITFRISKPTNTNCKN